MVQQVPNSGRSGSSLPDARRSLLPGLVVAVLLLLSACGQGSAPGASQVSTPVSTPHPATHVMRVGFTADMGPPDPAVFYAYEGSAVTTSVYEGLVRYKSDSSDFEGVLATSWDISPDFTVYTFHLRPRVLFQDGTSFDANAVIFSFKRMIAVNGPPAYMLAKVARMEAPNPLTFTVTLRAPQVSFIHLMASEWGPKMYSPTWVTAHEDKGDFAQAYMTQHALGTGPYLLQTFTPNKEYVLVNNPTYWRGWAGRHIEKIIIRIIPAISVQRQLLASGDLDLLAHGLPGADLAALASTPGVQVTDFPSNITAMVFLNVTRGVLKDVRIRQALAYLTPYDLIFTTTLKGHIFPMHTVYPDQVGVSGGTWTYTTSLAKAKALLTAAGYPNGGFTLDLAYTLDTSNTWGEISQLLKASYARAGIILTDHSIPYNQALDLIGHPDKEPMLLALDSTSDANDPFTWANPTWRSNGSFNLSGYTNPKLDTLIDAAEAQSGDRARFNLYGQVGDIVDHDVPIILLGQHADTFIYRASVQGITHQPAYPWSTDYFQIYKS